VRAAGAYADFENVKYGYGHIQFEVEQFFRWRA
jgi:hypothetical protein